MDKINAGPDRVRAEPFYSVADGDELICVRSDDGHVCTLNQAEATALNALSQFLPVERLIEHLAVTELKKALERFGRHKGLVRFLVNVVSDALDSGSPIFLKNLSALLQRRIGNVLTSLGERGLLISEKQLLRIASTGALRPEAEPARIRHIGIPTCRRPEKLKACLSSFIANLERWQRTNTTIIVADDSRDQIIEGRNREMILNADFKGVGQVHFIDSSKRNDYIDGLARRTGIARDVLEFGLSPKSQLPTHGAVRNVLSLMTAGVLALHADDDTLCRLSAGSYSGFAISGSTEPCQTQFYRNRRDNLKDHPIDGAANLLGIHEEYLGRPTSSVIEVDEVVWDDAGSDIVLALRTGLGKISLTQTGILGDCGLYSSAGFLVSCSPAALERASANDPQLDVLTNSCEVFRCARSKTLSRGKYFQAMSYGVDNREMTPPYFPIGRNEDGVFGVLSTLSDSNCWISHLPFAIYHQAEPNRRYSVNFDAAFSRIRITDIVLMCIESVSLPFPVARSSGLRIIGEQLVAIAQGSEKSFISFLRGRYLRSRTALIHSLERKLDSIEAKSSQWSFKIEKLIDTLRYSSNDLNIVPQDVERVSGPDQALITSQTALGLYGRLLIEWEHLVRSAREFDLIG